jgi:TrmH family RNA methyltransferase
MHGARALYPAAVQTSLAAVRIVLCRPSHPGNIGAAARAMKTMGVTDLRLVAPERFPAPEAQWLAAHAGDVLAAARVHAALDEALADCVAAFALSARPREWSPQALAAREAAAAALALTARGPVAFVFGAEAAGLRNEELFACQSLVHIPAHARYRSLNLAQAVQVVCYELFVACGAGVPEARGEKLATVADREGLYAHLEQAALASGFLAPESGSKLRERWRRLFSRVPRFEREEVNILRGLLNALQKRARDQ